MVYQHRTPVAALAYLLIGIIWYFVDEEAKKDSFVRFHVHQGVAFLIGAIIWSIVMHFVWVILALVFGWALGVGGTVSMLVGLLGYIPLIFLIIGLLNVLNGKEKELPVIGHWARKFTF